MVEEEGIRRDTKQGHREREGATLSKAIRDEESKRRRSEELARRYCMLESGEPLGGRR